VASTAVVDELMARRRLPPGSSSRSWRRFGNAARRSEVEGVGVADGNPFLMFSAPVHPFHLGHRWAWQSVGRLPR
jgi:hypothetical protein